MDKDFGELMLLEWGEVEFSIDLLFTKEFRSMLSQTELQKGNDLYSFLMKKLTFEDKLQFLEKRCLFKESELRNIRKFQHKRNSIFHGKSFIELYDDEKEEEIKTLKEIAINASGSCDSALKRYANNISKP